MFYGSGSTEMKRVISKQCIPSKLRRNQIARMCTTNVHYKRVNVTEYEFKVWLRPRRGGGAPGRWQLAARHMNLGSLHFTCSVCTRRTR